MKKLALLAMAVGLMMLMTGPASAARLVSDTYGTPALGQGDLLTTCLGGDAPADSCVVFAINPGETSVTVTITDDSGLPTYGTVGQDYNDDGLTDSATNFCGSTTVPFAVEDEVPLGVAEIIVFPHAGPGLGNDLMSPCAGAGTSGTVTADFS